MKHPFPVPRTNTITRRNIAYRQARRAREMAKDSHSLIAAHTS